MIQALIIDDEQHSIDRLHSMISADFDQSVHVADVCMNVEDGIKAIRDLHPDLIFLDIQLGDKTGFDLLKEIGDIKFEVIFITAYDQYAVRAFRFSALDYLLKPVDKTQLRSAIEKLKDSFSIREQSKKIETLFHNLGSLNGTAKKISIPTSNGFIFPPVSEIIRCEAEINYTRIFLKDQSKLTVARTLKEFEELLGDCNFFRVHNSHLVNLSYIKSYQRGKGGTITLTDGTQIEVSTRRKDHFLKRITGIN